MQISESPTNPTQELRQPSPVIEPETASRVGQEALESARKSLHASIARTWDPTVLAIVREIGAKDTALLQETFVKTRRTVELANEQEHSSNIDKLTGLHNKDSFIPMLIANISQAARRGESFAVMIIDLNDFKPINDKLGHHNGDRLLAHVGKGIRDTIRQGESANRIGGDEFAVQLSNITEDDAAKKAARINEKCAEVIMLTPPDEEDTATSIKKKDVAVSIDMSIGVNVLTTREVLALARRFKELTEMKKKLEVDPDQNALKLEQIEELINIEVSGVTAPADKKMYEDKANKGGGR